MWSLSAKARWMSHKAQVTASVRVPGADGERVGHVEQFATTVSGLLVIAGEVKRAECRRKLLRSGGGRWRKRRRQLSPDVRSSTQGPTSVVA